MTRTAPHTLPVPSRPHESPWPRLVGLGTATPSLALGVADTCERLARLWRLTGNDLARWSRIVAATGIETRYGVMPVEEVMGLSTQARMETYERCAPGLATSAARSALADAGVAAGAVTDLIVVSCTGFSAPGVDVSLVERLGLPPTVRRTIVGFMGCFGAIVGLRAAVGASVADPAGVCLVVCVELCSLHVRPERSVENQVASALFGDGAAAAVIVGDRVRAGHRSAESGRSLGRVTTGHSRLITRGRDWMSWRITDTGFAMTLTRDVPAALASRLGAIVEEVCPRRLGCYVVHPGGAGILDAVDQGLQLEGRSGLDAARSTLRRYGNMSSATLLFVLAEAFRRGYRPPAMLLAFGPGLAVEMMVLYR